MSVTCHACRAGRCLPYATVDGYHLYRCGTCGLIFVYPLPASIRDVYEEDYFEGATEGHGYVSYDADKEPMVSAFEKYLAYIAAVLPSKGRLLDVGAATGFFVEIAQKRGFDASGIELSDYAASRGRSKGLSIQTGVIDDISGSFDAITMLDVIEHVPDPRATLSKAASLLSPRGVLVINTPDADSLVARLLGRRWHAILPPEHLYYFDRKNMRSLLEETGFEVVLVKTIGKWFTIKYIFKTLHQSTRMNFFLKVSSLCSGWPLSKISIPINLYDSMFVLARKK